MTTHLATCHLDANLHALSASSPDAVARIRAAAARSDLIFIQTDDGVPTAQLGDGREVRLLASRRRPLDEAKRLISTLDVKDAAVYVVAGFGMGYHVAELTRRVGRTGLVIVYEPDVSLLRSVLERIDCTAWTTAGNVCILTDADDSAAMGEALRGLEGLIGLGVTLVQHPPSVPRLGSGTTRFHERFTGIVEAVKMTVITTLVQVRVTMRNLLQNVDAYVTEGGIEPLRNVLAGRPGIIVSAGPSLQRNIALLENPAVRDRCAIVAVQTVLRPLLQRGIRPHFVTALDYSEINRRFYEGLTAEQVEGITLVVEPKVNPSVLMAWPGRVLCAGDNTLDLVLGEKHAGRHGTIRQGATVAHLAYYLARFMGCDPVALVGQDLGFTDGQYYASGAAIHTIWGPELNEFKSLELMEWQRIVRMGAHLRRVRDVLDREMFTDSQMHSYLTQFETDFREDAAKGRTTIDATEGGVRKQCTTPQTLQSFLEQHATCGGADPIGQTLARAIAGAPPLRGEARAGAIRDLRKRLLDIRQQTERVSMHSARTTTTLAEMLEHRADGARVDRLISKAQKAADEVTTLMPGFGLTQLLAQGTVFNRVRADRMIQLNDGLDAKARQGLQIQRDIENVRGLQKAAVQLGEMLDDAIAAIDGGPRITRDMPKYEAELAREQRHAQSGFPASSTHERTRTVHAIIPVQLDHGGLGWKRSLAEPFGRHPSILAATVQRMLACRELEQIVLLGPLEQTRHLLAPEQLANGRVRVEELVVPPHARRARAVSAARLWSRACWRGGLADLTVFDEICEPRAIARAMERCGADAALLVGADWCVVDPTLCDDIIRRYHENPESHRLTFSTAVPGLCGCVIARELAVELCKGTEAEKVAHASIGGVLGYVPAAPLQDLIAHPLCAAVVGPARDCGLRLIADTPRMTAVLRELDPNADATSIADRALAILASTPEPPHELIIDRDGVDLAQEVHACGPNSCVAVTIGSPGWDPMDHGLSLSNVLAVRETGAAGVHLRSRLRGCTDADLRALLNSGIDVISIDCFDESDGLASSRTTLERLLSLRAEMLGDPGMGIPWIVPRLVRRDATYELVEEFINEWVIRCGWAALDGPIAVQPGERIAPLTLPSNAAERLRRTRRRA